MKKTLTLLAIGIVVLSGLGAAAIPNNDTSTIKKECILFSEPLLQESEYASSVFLHEATTYLHNPGQPVLPVVTKTYMFPLGTTISQVTCQPFNVVETVVSKDVTFAQRPVPLLADPELSVSETSRDEHVYMSAALYPSSWYRYTIGVGLYDRDHVVIVTVHVYPVRYSPAEHRLVYAQGVEILLEVDEPEHPVVFADAYDLVIIAPRKFSRLVRPLVAHKNDHGVETILVTTEEIYSDFDGRDKAEQVKYFIKHAVEDWGVSYVLLFGGMKGQRYFSWYVPARYSNLDDASEWETRYLSDLYFADIYKYDDVEGYVFDDWDSDGNNVFAEWNSEYKDVLDMFPDVYVGRLPVRYRFQVKDLVNRIITYETAAYGSEWFNRMVVIGGDSFDDISWNTSTDYIEGQEETAHALSFMDGFDHTRIWVEGGDVMFTPANTEEELNKGSGFVLFSGHGNPASWATHPHAEFDVWIDFGLKNIKNLTNGDKLPVLIVGGCHNSQFDTSLLRLLTQGRWAFWLGEFVPKCWSWLFASLPEGGSIASIGCSGLGYGTIGDGPDPPDEIPDGVPDGIPDCIQYLGGWIEGHFYEVYNHYGKDILGETHGRTITDYLTNFTIYWDMSWEDHENYSTLVDCKTPQEWVLMGDPSLKIGGYE
jgi:hypothetical protein